MKTYIYSYQNVRKPGRLRTASAGAGMLAGYPKGPECTYPGRNGIRPPPTGPWGRMHVPRGGL